MREMLPAGAPDAEGESQVLCAATPLRRYAVLRSLRAADCEDQSERALEASKKSSHRTEERSMERGASFRA